VIVEMGPENLLGGVYSRGSVYCKARWARHDDAPLASAFAGRYPLCAACGAKIAVMAEPDHGP